MAEKMSDADDYETDEDDDGEAFDVDEGMVDKQLLFKESAVARRRIEQLREEKALQRLLQGDFDDWD